MEPQSFNCGSSARPAIGTAVVRSEFRCDQVLEPQSSDCGSSAQPAIGPLLSDWISGVIRRWNRSRATAVPAPGLTSEPWFSDSGSDCGPDAGPVVVLRWFQPSTNLGNCICPTAVPNLRIAVGQRQFPWWLEHWNGSQLTAAPVFQLIFSTAVGREWFRKFIEDWNCSQTTAVPIIGSSSL